MRSCDAAARKVSDVDCAIEIECTLCAVPSDKNRLFSAKKEFYYSLWCARNRRVREEREEEREERERESVCSRAKEWHKRKCNYFTALFLH